MASVNRHLIIGNVGRPPVHFNEAGKTAMTAFSVATKTTYKNRQGDPSEETEWHSVVCFDRRALEAKNFRSGDEVMVEGTVRSRKFKNAQGEEKVTKEIHAIVCKLINKAHRETNSTTPEPGNELPEPQGNDNSTPLTTLL